MFQLICKGLSPLTRHFMTGRSAWWSVGLMLAVCSEGKFPKEGGTEKGIKIEESYSTLTLLAIILGCLTINEEGNEFAFA